MFKPYLLPERIQSFGVIAAQPDLPEAEWGAAEDIATAVAIATLIQRDDGHVELHVARHSNQREREFPLSHLVNQSLMPNATILVSPDERRILAVTAARDGHFVEPRLAALIGGAKTIDVAAAIVGAEPVAERGLARTLRLPWAEAPGVGTLAMSSAADRDKLLTEAALGRAITRLILWAHVSAVRSAEPALFYEPMRAVHAWLASCENVAPGLAAWATRSRILRAVSFWASYREDMEIRQSGGERIWPQFKDGLFHS